MSVSALLKGDYSAGLCQPHAIPVGRSKGERYAAQARNNREVQSAMEDFKEAFAEIVIEAQDAHNHIAEQLLKDERIFRCDAEDGREDGVAGVSAEVCSKMVVS